LQNASLAKDFTIAVIDGERGIGNGRVFPAGPLRAPLPAQLARVNALLVVGDDIAASSIATGRNLPILHARIEPDAQAVAAMKQRKALAFAGIGNTERFFATVKRAGIDAPIRKAFDDHHRFTAEEAAMLIMQAEHQGLSLLTTEKDRARIAGEPALAALAQRAHTLPITIAFDEEERLRSLLLAACGR
jgi:tetraacyldisaccharide 4'-kinase